MSDELLQHLNKFVSDQWAKTVNDESYSWKNMIPWFKRTETFHPSDKHGNQDLTLHGTDGPIQVSHPLILFNDYRANGS